MYVITEGLEKLDAKVLRKEQRCIHTDDWATIIHYARTNPWVYKTCMENGCTKSVKIKFPAESKLYDTHADKILNVVAANGDGSHTVKYAVSIYGIRQDKDKDGSLIGLTFGPATGENYTDGYRCHTESGSKATGTGDGPSVLYDSIHRNYLSWNKICSIAGTAGGWPASMIRTTLNGKESCMGDTKACVAGSNLLGESQALISAFPEELRNAIIPKAVKSDIVYNSEIVGNVRTTYDKLWLFSGRELRTGNPENDVRQNESNASTGYYQRASELNISTSSYANLIGYRESGSTNWWWLRSLYRSDLSSVYGVSGSGDWNYYCADSAYYGTAPGFCIGL